MARGIGILPGGAVCQDQQKMNLPVGHIGEAPAAKVAFGGPRPVGAGIKGPTERPCQIWAEVGEPPETAAAPRSSIRAAV